MERRPDITPAQAITDYTFTVRCAVDIRKPGHAHTVVASVANLITDALLNDVAFSRVLATGMDTPNLSIEIAPEPMRADPCAGRLQSCPDTTNPYVSRCGAKFDTDEERHAHEFKCPRFNTPRNRA